MSRLIDPPGNGIYFDVPAEEYHKWNAVSVSWLHKLHDSPATLRDWLYNDGEEQEDKKSLTLGTAVHCAILEGAKVFGERYVKALDLNKNTTAYKEWKKEQEAAGKIILNESDLRWCQAIVTRLAMSNRLLGMLRDAKTEVSLVGELNGTVCKARVDIWGQGFLADVKTTQKDRVAFKSEIFRRKYHAQAWWYMALAGSLGNCCLDFTFVAAHKTRPFLVSYHRQERAGAADGLGADYCLGLLKRFQECQESGKWPGYSDEPEEILPPSWAGESMGVEDESFEAEEEMV